MHGARRIRAIGWPRSDLKRPAHPWTARSVARRVADRRKPSCSRQRLHRCNDRITDAPHDAIPMPFIRCAGGRRQLLRPPPARQRGPYRETSARISRGEVEPCIASNGFTEPPHSAARSVSAPGRHISPGGAGRASADRTLRSTRMAVRCRVARTVGAHRDCAVQHRDFIPVGFPPHLRWNSGECGGRTGAASGNFRRAKPCAPRL